MRDRNAVIQAFDCAICLGARKPATHKKPEVSAKLKPAGFHVRRGVYLFHGLAGAAMS